MTLQEIVDRLHLSVQTGENRLDRVVTGGYSSDVLSDVIAKAKVNNVWVTMQTHENIVAVAVRNGLAGIIIVQGRQPASETVEKAMKQNVVIMVSDLPSFDTVGMLSSALGKSNGSTLGMPGP